MIATARVQPAEALRILKTAQGETGGRQLVEIGQLLDMAIPDRAAGLVSFPDDRGIMSLRIALCGVNERRVPRPRVGSGDADAAPGQEQGGLAAHAAA